MRYKDLILRKIEESDNIMLGLQSLLSNFNTTREQIENLLERQKNKSEEIRTLINSEQG